MPPEQNHCGIKNGSAVNHCIVFNPIVVLISRWREIIDGVSILHSRCQRMAARYLLLMPIFLLAFCR